MAYQSSGDSVQTAQNIVMTSTANAVTVSSLNAYASAGVQITGTWTGTVIFESSDDGGTTYFSVPAVAVGGTGVLVTTATANGQWQANIAGAANFRVRCSATGTGTAVVSIRATLGPSGVIVNAPLPAGANIIGALTANQSSNVAQLAGTAIDTNSGNKSAGTQRVVLATDQPQLTNKFLVTPDANSAVNVAQINGVTALMGNGVTGTGSQRVTVASDNTAFAIKVDQTTPGTTDRVTVGGKSIKVSVEKVRPADTTAYTAKDAIDSSTSSPTGWVFSSIARITGGTGYIVKATVMTDQTTCVETFKLHLFNAAPTYLNDNAACTAPLYANVSSYVGSILFPACAVEGTGSTAAYANAVPGTNATVNLPMKFMCNADSSLYGIVEAVIGFTPANAQKISIILVSEVD